MASPDDRSPVINYFEAAASDAERARRLLQLNDGLVLELGGELNHACRRCGFTAGSQYLDIRTAALLAMRMPNGELPLRQQASLELWRRGLVAVAEGMAA